MVHAFFDPAQTAAFNEAALKRDSDFEIRYFGLHGLGDMARMMLAAGGAKFTTINPENWAEEKPKAPFGVMPLLKETTSDGKVIQISESSAIDRYIAKKFGFLGDNAFEENLVNTFVSNDQSLQDQIFVKYLRIKDVEEKAEAKKLLVENSVAPWIKNHEQHLQANGANGHYVGNKTTMADFKTAMMVRMVQGIIGEDIISQKKTPALLKVKTQVDNIPSLAAWRTTDEYKALAEKNFAILCYN